jgi:hypothetical protein
MMGQPRQAGQSPPPPAGTALPPQAASRRAGRCWPVWRRAESPRAVGDRHGNNWAYPESNSLWRATHRSIIHFGKKSFPVTCGHGMRRSRTGSQSVSPGGTRDECFLPSGIRWVAARLYTLSRYTWLSRHRRLNIGFHSDLRRPTSRGDL